VWAVNFQVTVLKVLVSYPDGFAAMADLKRDMAILATSGRDWAERTKGLTARLPDLLLPRSHRADQSGLRGTFQCASLSFAPLTESVPPKLYGGTRSCRRDGYRLGY
jgi:hypothetical protein